MIELEYEIAKFQNTKKGECFMNNLRKIFCAVLVLALLCSALAFAISAETSTDETFVPLRTLGDAHIPTATKSTESTAVGNLFGDFADLGERATYGNTIQTYVVTEQGVTDDNGYYLARIESDGRQVSYNTNMDSHSHLNIFFYDKADSTLFGPKLDHGDVFVYETDMFFEDNAFTGLYFSLNVRASASSTDPSSGSDYWVEQDRTIVDKLPKGEWFHLTVLGDVDSDSLYYYVNGEYVSTFANAVVNAKQNGDPDETVYALHSIRWQFYQATLNHGDSLAFDNVFCNVITSADLGDYTLGAPTLDDFAQAQRYSLRELVPVAKVDGETVYSVAQLNNRLATALTDVEVEMLRDTNAAIAVTCDATIKTNGLPVVITTPDGAKKKESEDGIIEVDVPYTPAYTAEDGGFDASFINSNGDKSISILNGCYGSIDYFASDSKISPYAGGDSYLKVTPVKNTQIGSNVEEVRIYYTDRYYLEMNDFYVIDFDVATESEYADLVLIPVLAHETSDSKPKVRLDGKTIRFKDFLDPSNEWAHVTVIGDIANNKMYIFVNDELKFDNYGMAYNADVAKENNMDLTEKFENKHSTGPLNFVELRLGFTGKDAESTISTTDTTLFKNLAVRRFAGTENEAISTAVEGESLTNWENNKNTTKGEKLPSIIVVDGVGYGNIVLANEVISKDNGTTKEISFRADFEYPIYVDSAAVIETNGLGEYIIEGKDEGPIYFEEYGIPAMIVSSTSIVEDNGTITISKVNVANPSESCHAVYWAADAEWSDYYTVYYPAGTEITYVEYPGVSFVPKNYIKDGMLNGFGWANLEDGKIVDSFGSAVAGADDSYSLTTVQEPTDITLPGAMYNLSLYTDYAINLFVPANIYRGEEAETVTARGVEYVVLTKDVAATEIDKAVEFEVTYDYEGVEYTEYIEVSVIEYAEAVMASGYSKMLKKTIMAALNYSETAIEELVNAEGSAEIKAILNAEANAEYRPAGMTESASSDAPAGLDFFKSAFLHIDATPDFVFEAKDTFVGKITFTYQGVEGEVTVTKEVDATQNAYIVLDNVKVYDMTATIKIAAEGTINGSGEYSLETYIGSEECKTAEALYVYATVAKAYKLACIKVADNPIDE